MTVRQDLHIRQGETWSFVWTKKDQNGSPVDLSSYTARASIKGTYNGVLQAYLSTGSDADNGTIALASNGTVTLAMTADQSARLAGELNALTSLIVRDAERLSSAFKFIDQSQPTATYRYDLELVAPDGTVTRELEGHVIVHREITT